MHNPSHEMYGAGDCSGCGGGGGGWAPPCGWGRGWVGGATRCPSGRGRRGERALPPFCASASVDAGCARPAAGTGARRRRG